MSKEISKRKAVDFILVMMIFSIFFENIKLFNIVGTAFKPTHVIFIWAIFLILGGLKKPIKGKEILLLMFFLLLPVFPIYRINDIPEWLKSYVIWVIGTFYLCTSFSTIYYYFQKKRSKLIKLFIYSMVVVQLIAVVQFVLMNTVGTMYLQNVFGPFQYIESYVSSKNGIFRAYSIFHEPSVLGWVNTTAFACLLYTTSENIFTKKFRYFSYILILMTMIVSLSASGMYIYVGLIAVYLLINHKKFSSLAGLVTFIVAGIYLWNFTTILAPMKRLFIEYDTVNSSGYERFNTPMQYAVKTIQNYPFFGRGLGQNGEIDTVGVIDEAIAPTANNSIYEVVVNFGLSAVFLYSLFFKVYIRRIIKNKNYILIVLNLIGVLFTTGAYLSLDFLVILNFSLLLYKPADKSQLLNGGESFENTMGV